MGDRVYNQRNVVNNLIKKGKLEDPDSKNMLVFSTFANKPKIESPHKFVSAEECCKQNMHVFSLIMLKH